MPNKQLFLFLVLFPAVSAASTFFSFPSIDDVLSDVKSFGMGILFVLVILNFHEVLARFLRFRIFQKRRKW